MSDPDMALDKTRDVPGDEEWVLATAEVVPTKSAASKVAARLGPSGWTVVECAGGWVVHSGMKFKTPASGTAAWRDWAKERLADSFDWRRSRWTRAS